MPLDLLPYQDEGARVLATKRRYGLFDDMGLGKTATTIRAMDLIRAKRAMIVAPAAVRENWRGEFSKFALLPRRVVKGENIHDYVAWKNFRFDVLVTSYELATKWAPKFEDEPDVLDALVFDEAHYLKNLSAQRTQALIESSDKFGTAHEGLIKWAAHAWMLTGTPMANDPFDIYTFLRFARAMPLTPKQFKKRYFIAREGTYSTRHKPILEMIPELRKLIGNNSVRRVKSDVNIQLPPIFLTTALLDGDNSEILRLLAEHPGLEQAIIFAVEQGSLSQIDAQYVATLRRLLGMAKAVPYAHMLYDEIVQGGDKRVVMGVHRDALAHIRSFLTARGIWAVLLNGETPERERTALVNAFQTDERCRVFIGNIRAAGTGLTLTAACEIDMLESDWTPAGNAQALMRVHRISQTRNVRARFMTLARTFDEVVTRVVAEKTAAIADIEGHAMTASPAIDAGIGVA